MFNQISNCARMLAVCLPMMAALPAAAAPLQVKQISPQFTLEQIAPDVYAFISNNTTHDWEDGNSVAIVGDRCVAVVDAPATYLSKQHLAEIRKITNRPVCYVINTHFHRDHVMGNHVYKDAFPNAMVVQQDYTAALADRRDPAAMDALKAKDGADLLHKLQDAANRGVDASGQPLSGYDLDRAKRSYKEFLPVYRDAQNARYVPADITFDNTMTIKLGGTDLQLLHMVGHTLGDTVVWLPRQKILITGDLVIAPVPYGGIDYYNEWIASLDKLIAFNATAIVPGHGDVEFSQDYMTLERDLFQSLMDQAVAAVNQRRTLDEFKKTLDLSSFEAKFVHGDPELKWGWDNYFNGKSGALASRAYRTAYGAL